MNYCVSDIHEQKQLFMQLLKLIQFGDSDHMYILGDVLARGDGSGIELLRLIMSRPEQFTLVAGNHEIDFAQAILEGTTVEDHARWERMHSQKTAEAFFALTKNEQTDILCFLRSLPSYMDISVAGKDYHLVHGWPGYTIRERVWGRPSIFTQNPFEDRKLIVGHTPVVLLHCRNDMEQNAYFHNLEASGDHMRILHAPGGWIDLDCACSYPVPGAALGCLRLEDGAEFYVRSDVKVTV